MGMSSLRFRQIHLDFHTSELIAPIAQDFDPEAFADTLVRAHVDSITCFSRCHHGMIYHDTIFSELRHPGLSRNLLAEQIEACHKRGINVPVYITVGWDEYQSSRHPEWIEQYAGGELSGGGPLEPRWKNLCFNTGYVDFVCEQTTEVLERFDIDGVFFDIIFQGPCICPRCLAGMREAGINPESEAGRVEYARHVVSRLRERLSGVVRQDKSGCPVFFNAGHIDPAMRPDLDTYSHLELESLPSGGWGYDHFPMTVRYARTLGLETMGMTGKFHRSWADFGGFKNQAALEFECFSALAEGAKCSIGDQLHPRGNLDPATYELIGSVYSQVEAREPWCAGAVPQTEIAIFNPEATGQADDRVDTAANGALRMLIEAHHQFDIIDAESDWEAYRVMVFPDKIAFTEAMAEKFSGYLQQGGAALLTHKAGISAEDPDAFRLPEMPAKLAGEARFSPNYLMAHGPLARHVPDAQHIMYEGGVEVTPSEDAEVLAELWWPYFNRRWDHFCSHAQTPPEKASGLPAALRRGRVIQFTHPLFSLYMRHGTRTYKQLVLNALAMLLPEPLVITNAPSTARLTLTKQAEHKRTILHLSHYVPEQRSREIATIEEALPLHDVDCNLRATGVKRVTLEPGGTALDFEQRGERILFTVPRVEGHTMAVLEHE